MSNFIQNIIKLAKEYRASEQDALRISSVSKKQREQCWANINFVRQHFNLPELRDDARIQPTSKTNAHHPFGIINPSLNDVVVQNDKRRKILQKMVKENKLNNVNIDNLQQSDLSSMQIAIIYQILRTKRLRNPDHARQHQKGKEAIWNNVITNLQENINRYNDLFKYVQQIFCQFKISNAQIKQIMDAIKEIVKSWQPPIKR